MKHRSDWVASLSETCLGSPLPSTGPRLVSRDSEPRPLCPAPIPVSNLSLTGTSSLPSLSPAPVAHVPVLWVPAFVKRLLTLTATSKSFAQLVSFAYMVFPSLVLWKENSIHHLKLRFLRLTARMSGLQSPI